MMSDLIKEIDDFFDQLADILPSYREIEEFEQFIEQFNQFMKDEDPSDIMENLKSLDLLKINYGITKFEQKNETLVNFQHKVNELKHQISDCDSEYERMLEEKSLIQEKMKELDTDRDIILVFKLGTLSHFCYTQKIQFGFLFDKKNLDHYKCFPCNLNSNTPEEMECRWQILEEFVKTKKKQ